jgi:glucosamine-6-phosphate deaminase
MRIQVFSDMELCGEAAAAIIAAQILMKPDTVLGLATGDTPLPLYRKLIEYCRRGLVDFSAVRTFNLDEYIGLPVSHPDTYRAFMETHLFNHINIKRENTDIPNGSALDPDAEIRRYDEAIRAAGGIDIQVLGIGRNGHIGFNEPDQCFSYGTHTVTLSLSTVEANSRHFKDRKDVPERAVSMGIGGILSAKRILLIAAGAQKADAVQATVHGDITPLMPASVLRLHPEVLLLLDEAAAHKI